MLVNKLYKYSISSRGRGNVDNQRQILTGAGIHNNSAGKTVGIAWENSSFYTPDQKPKGKSAGNPQNFPQSGQGEKLHIPNLSTHYPHGAQGKELL